MGIEDSDEFMEHLINIGALVEIGISTDGTPRYSVTKVCLEQYPELYSMLMADVSSFINSMWQKDMLELNFAEEGIMVGLNQNSANIEKINELPPDERDQMYDLLAFYIEKYDGIMIEGDDVD